MAKQNNYRQDFFSKVCVCVFSLLYVCMLSHFSVQLFATPWTLAHQASLPRDSISGDPEKADSRRQGRSQAVYKFVARGR